jgi:DNA modification methylase
MTRWRRPVKIPIVRNDSEEAVAFLLPQRPNLRFECCPRPEQIDERPTNKSAKIPHPATGYGCVRLRRRALCADAIMDVTNRGEIILDPFLGAGSTLVAAQRTSPRCFGSELDPRFDVIIRRYKEIYGSAARLEATGETIEDLARRR